MEPTATTITLSTVEPEPTEWLFTDQVPLRKLTLLVGEGGVGKGTLVAHYAARVSTGQNQPSGQPSAPRAVLWLSAEDGLADTLRPRCQAAATTTVDITPYLHSALRSIGRDLIG